MEFSQCNCAALRSATRILTAAYDEVLRPLGLRTTQFSILARLAAAGPIMQNQLAESMAMDRTTLGRNLRPLERENLLQLEIGTDRRERVISLTPEGRRMLAAARPLWESIQVRFEDRFGAKQATQLREMMKSIVNTGRELSAENNPETRI